MFWECSADVHNDAVSSMMSRKRFDDIMKYLHLADNTSLDPNNKFSKVRSLLDKLNINSVFPTTSLCKQSILTNQWFPTSADVDGSNSKIWIQTFGCCNSTRTYHSNLSLHG